jgi:hypothetical protein
MYEVREIRDDKGMNDFHSVAAGIYRDNPKWVRPPVSILREVLDPRKNPYFAVASLRIFVCYSDHKPVCRSILVINHQYWQRWNKRTAFFGFFEAEDDTAAVRYLFGRLESVAGDSGAESLEGPFNPNHYSELGILTDNFEDKPLFFESYNPPYYPRLLTEAGFGESFRTHTMINRNIRETLNEKFRIPYHQSPGSEITVRKFNILRYRKDLEILRDINNDAFRENNYFLPLSAREYDFSGRYYFLITKPSFILIAEHKGIPVGAVQFVLNFNALLQQVKGEMKLRHVPLLLLRRRKAKELLVFTCGVKKAYRQTRILTALFSAGVEVLRGCTSVSTTWISDEKLGNVAARLLDMKAYKHYSIYSKSIHTTR